MAKAESKPKKTPVRRTETGAARPAVKPSEPVKKAAKRASKSVKAPPPKAADAAKRPAVAKKPVASKKASPRAGTDATAAKTATPKKAVAVPKRAPAAKRASPAKPDAAKSTRKDTTKKPEPDAAAALAKAATATATEPKAAKPEKALAEPVKKAVRKTTVICPLSGFEVKPDKPNLSPRTVDRLRTRLLDERSRHMSQAEELQAEAAQLALDREEGDTQFDEEGGEGDTISVERERDLMLSASARQIVEEIDRALERIRNKTYGLCTPAGRRISVERLEALPYAETCVDCKARAERRR
jgi:RNA polymerase-binding transcription factor